MKYLFYLWKVEVAAEVEMVVKSQFFCEAIPILLPAPDWFHEVGEAAQVLPACPDPAKSFSFNNHNKPTYLSFLYDSLGVEVHWIHKY